MSKRLTRPRLERWQADILKQQKALSKLHTEVQGYRLEAKGGRYEKMFHVERGISAAVDNLRHEAESVRRMVEQWR